MKIELCPLVLLRIKVGPTCESTDEDGAVTTCVSTDGDRAVATCEATVEYRTVDICVRTDEDKVVDSFILIFFTTDGDATIENVVFETARVVFSNDVVLIFEGDDDSGDVAVTGCGVAMTEDMVVTVVDLVIDSVAASEQEHKTGIKYAFLPDLADEF